MQELITWLKKNTNKLHPVVLSALLHHKLVAIHPFFDGNGRTSRLVMNVMLMQKGFPLAIILKADRKKYYTVLQKADDGNLKPLVLLVAQAVERSLDLYIRTFATEHAGTLVTLSDAARGSKYTAKYLNLLARTGQLFAVKHGRLWHTTKEAIKDYEQNRLRKR